MDRNFNSVSTHTATEINNEQSFILRNPDIKKKQLNENEFRQFNNIQRYNQAINLYNNNNNNSHHILTNGFLKPQIIQNSNSNRNSLKIISINTTNSKTNFYEKLVSTGSKSAVVKTISKQNNTTKIDISNLNDYLGSNKAKNAFLNTLKNLEESKKKTNGIFANQSEPNLINIDQKLTNNDTKNQHKKQTISIESNNTETINIDNSNNNSKSTYKQYNDTIPDYQKITVPITISDRAQLFKKQNNNELLDSYFKERAKTCESNNFLKREPENNARPFNIKTNFSTLVNIDRISNNNNNNNINSNNSNNNNSNFANNVSATIINSNNDKNTSNSTNYINTATINATVITTNNIITLNGGNNHNNNNNMNTNNTTNKTTNMNIKLEYETSNVSTMLFKRNIASEYYKTHDLKLRKPKPEVNLLHENKTDTLASNSTSSLNNEPSKTQSSTNTNTSTHNTRLIYTTSTQLVNNKNNGYEKKDSSGKFEIYFNKNNNNNNVLKPQEKIIQISTSTNATNTNGSNHNSDNTKTKIIDLINHKNNPILSKTQHISNLNKKESNCFIKMSEPKNQSNEGNDENLNEESYDANVINGNNDDNDDVDDDDDDADDDDDDGPGFDDEEDEVKSIANSGYKSSCNTVDSDNESNDEEDESLDDTTTSDDNNINDDSENGKTIKYDFDYASVLSNVIKNEFGTQTVYKSPLRPSLFLNVPPTITFVTINEKINTLPETLKKMFKWKITSLTPNIVKSTLSRSNFTPTTQKYSWIGTWDKNMKPERFKILKEYQKFNHYPGSFQIGRKDRLCRNLYHAQAIHGKEEYNFVPMTFVLPSDYNLLKNEMENPVNKKTIWILKPPASARGIGIRIAHKIEQISKKKPCVVQRYISNPYLINGLKFDLRIYVYVTSYDPLRIFIFKDGLTRFASRKYSSSCKTIHDKYIHLTNFSINKTNNEYKSNDDENSCTGHKWSLKALWSYLAKKGINTDDIWKKIKDLVIKTIIVSEAHVNVLVKGNVKRKYSVHELFGFDVMLDENLKPWVIECNISPSLHSSSPLDISIKGQMIADLLNIAGYMIPDPKDLAHAEGKKSHKKIPKQLVQDKRVLPQQLSNDEKVKHQFYVSRWSDYQTRKTITNVLTPDDLRMLIEFEDEHSRRGDFTCIFPTHESTKYMKLFETTRYYNILLIEWLDKYHLNRDKGIQIINQYCKSKIHLQNPAINMENQWSSDKTPVRQSINFEYNNNPTSGKRKTINSGYKNEDTN